tara:strand:+ start:111 stop:1073 length:963 start_codon:yes stop_codon:yes gene_type:complete
MSTKYILIILGEPFSTFSEILGKYFSKRTKSKKVIILIGNKKLFNDQLKKLKYKLELNEINNLRNAKKNMINFFNISFKYNKAFSKISIKSKKYIESSFDTALDIIKKNEDKFILINGPVSKKAFLQKKYLGITEYLSRKTNTKNEVMLIYNEKLSVSPITTHIPLKYVAKQISKKKIVNNILKINNYYKEILKKKTSFAILGINPHCETIDRFSEEDKIIKPSINILKKKKINIEGPFAADTFFLKKNIKKYNVVVGMYHDQVLTPIKTIFNFNAINVTIGLPFIRISPDHGPNSIMLGKNKSDPSSFEYAMKFIEKLK